MNKKTKGYYVEEKVQPAIGFWETLSSTFYNLKYQANKAYSEFKEKIYDPEDTLQKQIFIQGNKYTTRKQAKIIVKNILWFSYRKNIQIKNDHNDYRSDVGWGCLARVGQMALASALKKHFQIQSQRLNIQIPQSHVENIITAFNDVEGSAKKYSLNKILSIADQMFHQKVGQWFNISSISSSLKNLQNKNPMRGAEGMKVMFFDQCIYIQEIFKLQNLKLCSCPKKAIVCQKCHQNFQVEKCLNKPILVKNKDNMIQTLNKTSKESFQRLEETKMMKKESTIQHSKGISMSLNQQKSNKNLKSGLNLFRKKVFDRDLCLFVLTRVGDSSNIETIDKAVFMLLDLSFCFGIMTGFPREAIFVVGREGNKLIYLNPHYVQEHDTRDMSQKESYFCSDYLLCQRKDLDPSMGFCFYIQTIAELQQLDQKINYISRNYGDTLSIGINLGWCKYDTKEYIENDNDDDSISNFSDFSAFEA